MAAPGGRRDEANNSRSERVYRSLLRAYPKDLRREHGEEMARTFRDLRRREVEGRGVRGIASLWGRALSELAFTALKERSTMLARNLARNAYLPARPAVVTRWGGLSALLGGVVGTAAYYVGVSVSLPLSFVVLLFSVLLCTLGLFGLYGSLAAASGRIGHPGRVAVVGASLAAVSVVSWVALGAFRALVPVWGWVVGPTHAASATAFCCWFAGLLLLGVAALKTRPPGLLRVLPLTVIGLVPVSVVLPMFTTVGMPFVISLPFLGTALLGWFLLRSSGNEGLAVPGRAGRAWSQSPAAWRRRSSQAPEHLSRRPPKKRRCWRLSGGAGSWRWRGRPLRPRLRWRMPTECSRRWRPRDTWRFGSSGAGCSTRSGKATPPTLEFGRRGR